MDIQAQANEVVVRLASMEKMRQMQLRMGDAIAAARTLDAMADVFGNGPSSTELIGVAKNSLPKGNMTSANDYWRASLSGFVATYDNGSNTNSSVLAMVERAQRMQPMIEDVVPPALAEYVRPGIIDAAYRYATRVQHKVGSALGAVLPLSVADTDRKIQEVNNRATMLDFVVRFPSVGSTFNGYSRRSL